MLDQAWAQFTSPQALAAAQLWMAAWSEPELAKTLRDLEERLERIIEATAAMFLADQGGDRGFPAMIDAAISMIRGLLMAIPIAGREAVDGAGRRSSRSSSEPPTSSSTKPPKLALSAAPRVI